MIALLPESNAGDFPKVQRLAVLGAPTTVEPRLVLGHTGIALTARPEVLFEIVL